MVLDVIEYSFGLMKNKPKILLLQVLNWIPWVALIGLVYFGILEITNVSFTIDMMIGLIIKYAGIAFFLFVAAMLTNALVAAAYPEIARQAFAKKEISLSLALNVAKKRFGSVLWTGLVAMFLAILVMCGLFATILVPVLGWLIFIIGFVVILVYAMPGLFMLNTVVVLENLSGMQAIKRSFELSKGRKMSIWGLISLLGIFSAGIGLLEYTPVIGLLLMLPANAVTMSWSYLASPSYYFMRIKNAKPSAK